MSFVQLQSIAIVLIMISGGFCAVDKCPADGTPCGYGEPRNCTYSQGSCHTKHCEAPSESDFGLCAATAAVVIGSDDRFGPALEIETELKIVTGVALLPCVGNVSSLSARNWVLRVKHAGCSAAELTELMRDASIVVTNGSIKVTSGRFRTIESMVDKSCATWNRVDPAQDCLDPITCDSSGATSTTVNANAALCIAGALVAAERATWPSLVVALGLVAVASAQNVTDNNNSNSVNSTCSAWLEVVWQSTQRDRVHTFSNETSHTVSLDVAVVVAGRPFVTPDGESVVASVAPTAHAATTALSSAHATSSSLSRALVDAAALEIADASAESWLQQAIAEHASVASFAQFALDLMANAAPSPLLMSALRAAQDEVLHADACLEMARASAPGRNLSFTAFPSAAIDGARAHSLLDLARSTMRDGAIAELLSTLLVVERAAEAQRRSLHHVAAVWRAIATDEARHALLAWRTVAWCVATAANSDRQRLQHALNDEVSLAAKVARGDTHQRAVADLIAPLLARVNAGAFVDGGADAEAYLTSLLTESASFDVATVIEAILASAAQR